MRARMFGGQNQQKYHLEALHACWGPPGCGSRWASPWCEIRRGLATHIAPGSGCQQAQRKRSEERYRAVVRQAGGQKPLLADLGTGRVLESNASLQDLADTAEELLGMSIYEFMLAETGSHHPQRRAERKSFRQRAVPPQGLALWWTWRSATIPLP